jgi:hypothetical protein
VPLAQARRHTPRRGRRGPGDRGSQRFGSSASRGGFYRGGSPKPTTTGPVPGCQLRTSRRVRPRHVGRRRPSTPRKPAPAVQARGSLCDALMVPLRALVSAVAPIAVALTAYLHAGAVSALVAAHVGAAPLPPSDARPLATAPKARRSVGALRALRADPGRRRRTPRRADRARRPAARRHVRHPVMISGSRTGAPRRRRAGGLRRRARDRAARS